MSPRRIFKDASQPAGPTLEEALAQVDLSEDEVDPAGEAFRENWRRDESSDRMRMMLVAGIIESFAKT